MHRFVFIIITFYMIGVLFSQSYFDEIMTQKIQNDKNNISLNITNESTKKSSTLAFFLSLAIPGAGEYYLNRFDLGKYFLLAEGTLWLTVAGFNTYGNWQKENYINFAKVNAGVNDANKDETYWATIGNYLSIEDYNNEKLLNREFSKVLDINTHYWFWKTNDERKKYRSLWLSSEKAFNNVQFPLALIVINHLASAINSAIIASRMKSKDEITFHFFPNVSLDNFNQLQLTFNLVKIF